MNATDDHIPEREGDDLVAAEYVLGVLPDEERRQAARRIETDAAFARLVDQWEVRLSPMASAYGEEAAPAGAKAAIDRRLFGAKERIAGPGFWNSLAFWRGLAAAALAALVLYVAIPLVAPPQAADETRFVASIAPSNSDVAYLAVYDAGKGEVSLSHTSGERGDGRDFELWMVEGGNAPVSMGVIPAGASVRLQVDPAIGEKLAAGVALAVSREPLGGSTTGSPTEVVAAGGLTVI